MRHGANGHEMRLRGGGEINEDDDEDEDQQRVAEQAEKPEREGNPLTDRRRDLGRSYITKPRREQRAQHTPAIHREGGNQVEQGEEQIDLAKPIDEAGARVLDRD